MTTLFVRTTDNWTTTHADAENIRIEGDELVYDRAETEVRLDLAALHVHEGALDSYCSAVRMFARIVSGRAAQHSTAPRLLHRMTIVASVKVHDGLVLGTDSMTQIVSTSQGSVLKTYTNARKLFQVKDFPIGVMTWGIGNLGVRSIQGAVFDYAKSLSDAPITVQEAVQGLFDHVKPQYDVAFPGAEVGQGQDLGLFVAGYSPGEPLAEEYEFVLPRDAAPSPIRSPDQTGAAWRGIYAPYQRIARGIDPGIVEVLKARGLTDAEIEEMAAGARMTVIFDGMPVQDAVNYCAFILDTTIGWASFQWGAQSCARPLQVATILESDGFHWVARPALKVPLVEPIGGLT